MYLQELPKRKVAMTQETSKVIRETDNPFGDDEEEAAEAKRQQQRQGAAGSSRDAYGEWEPNIGVAIDMHGPMTRPGRTPGGFGKSDSKKDRFKRKSKDGGRKPFNLEAEKEKMKSVIAESSISSTNLMNSLQTINRERERISENQQVVRSFEACKQLRRRILRYVSVVSFLTSVVNGETAHRIGPAFCGFMQVSQLTIYPPIRFIRLKASNGWAAFSMPMTSLSMRSWRSSKWTTPLMPIATQTTKLPSKPTCTGVCCGLSTSFTAPTIFLASTYT